MRGLRAGVGPPAELGSTAGSAAVGSPAGFAGFLPNRSDGGDSRRRRGERARLQSLAAVSRRAIAQLVELVAVPAAGRRVRHAGSGLLRGAVQSQHFGSYDVFACVARSDFLVSAVRAAR